MSNKKCCSSGRCSSDPSSSNYAEEMNNNPHSKSPSGEAEPSVRTTYKYKNK